MWSEEKQVLQTKVTLTHNSLVCWTEFWKPVILEDFGSRVSLNKSNLSPFNFSQESRTHLVSMLFIPLKSMWRNNWVRASLLTAVCFARLPAIKCQHPSSCTIQTSRFWVVSCSWPRNIFTSEKQHRTSLGRSIATCLGSVVWAWMFQLNTLVNAPRVWWNCSKCYWGESAISLINYRRKKWLWFSSKREVFWMGRTYLHKSEQDSQRFNFFFWSGSCDGLKKQPCSAVRIKHTVSVILPQGDISSSFTETSSVFWRSGASVWSAELKVSPVIFLLAFCLHLH